MEWKKCSLKPDELAEQLAEMLRERAPWAVWKAEAITSEDDPRYKWRPRIILEGTCQLGGRASHRVMEVDLSALYGTEVRPTELEASVGLWFVLNLIQLLEYEAAPVVIKALAAMDDRPWMPHEWVQKALQQEAVK